MADNNKEAAIAVSYFKTFQSLVRSILAFIIKLMPFDLRPLACVLWNLEETEEKTVSYFFPGRERGEKNSQVAHLRKRKGKAGHRFLMAAFPLSSSVLVL